MKRTFVYCLLSLLLFSVFDTKILFLVDSHPFAADADEVKFSFLNETRTDSLGWPSIGKDDYESATVPTTASSSRGIIPPPPIQWTRTYGKARWDESYSLVQTNDGGYALAGYSEMGQCNRDFWLVKTNSTGHTEWNKTWGGPDDEAWEEAYSVVQTEDGGLAIGGYTVSFGAGDADFWLIKTDISGSVQLNITYGEGGADKALSMIQTSDGGFVLAGFGFANLIKIDLSGTLQWKKTYYGAGTAHSVIQTEDGGYALACSVRLVKVDSSGNLQWEKTYEGMTLTDVVQTSDGGYALIGDGESMNFVKTDADGNLQWSKLYKGKLSSFIQTTDGEYVVAAYKSPSFQNYEWWLFGTNSTGDLRWEGIYGGSSQDYAYSVIQTADGGYAFAGSTDSYGAGEFDFWLIKMAGMWPPIVSLYVPSTSFVEDSQIEFDASASYDPDGTIVLYFYDYGDGSNSGWISDPVHHRSYPDPGEYIARVKVKDGDNLESDWSNSISIYIVSQEIYNLTKEYFPHLVFDEEETYFPTDFCYDDDNILNNPEDYSVAWPFSAYIHVPRSGTWSGGTYLAIEYWFYYAYDSKKHLQPPPYFLFPGHNHDWESIFILFSRKGNEYMPSWIIYFNHETLENLAITEHYRIYPWTKPEDIDKPFFETIDGTHPIVHVARGSHASYEKTVAGYGAYTLGLFTVIEPCDNGLTLDSDDFEKKFVASPDPKWPQKRFETVDAPWNRRRWDDPGYFTSTLERSNFTAIGLQESQSKLHLHMYDGNRHVGVNYTTSDIDCSIYRSSYFEFGNSSFIALSPCYVNVSFVVDARYAHRPLENFNITVWFVRDDWLMAQIQRSYTIRLGEEQHFDVRMFHNRTVTITVLPQTMDAASCYFLVGAVAVSVVLVTALAVYRRRKRPNSSSARFSTEPLT